MNQLQQIKHNLRMKNAALRQFLRDRSDEMTEEERDQVLDELNRNLEALKAIEEFETGGQ